MSTGLAPRLPRGVAADPRAAGLARVLEEQARPLWAGGTLAVPHAALTRPLAAVLQAGLAAGRVVRGLEGAERTLASEARGLRLAGGGHGSTTGRRISRVLLIAGDGAERFYRHVETLLGRHAARVLGVRLEIDAAALGAAYGAGAVARLLMLAHREVVVAALLAMAQDVAVAPACAHGRGETS